VIRAAPFSIAAKLRFPVDAEQVKRDRPSGRGGQDPAVNNVVSFGALSRGPFMA